MTALHRSFASAALAFVFIASPVAGGFGMFKKVVAINRIAPPQVVLPVKRIRIVFNDTTRAAVELRERIEARIHAGDPEITFANDAPYILTIDVTRFAGGRNETIDGTYRLSDRADREIAQGSISSSNAGALIRDSREELIDDAADDVVRIVAPIRHASAVVVPKGNLDGAVSAAEHGDWNAYLAAIERVRNDDPYRQYALAVAHEGIAYQARDLDAAVRHLREAITRNIAAAKALPSEKLISEQFMPMTRAFDTPGTPPAIWVSPDSMERWESMLRIRTWMNAPPASKGTLDNRGVLEMFVAGRPDSEILDDIAHADRVRFSLERGDMTALVKAGAPWSVVDKMRSKAGLPRREFWITPDRW